ncbi:STE3-domain-containing protein [Rickenella mellea]|uniref:STE3-domain-containing protein n=1 Tax=Rickenella mellea TaxID=50990 RepID=A0A4Y7QGZ6_9AGAM|nr:STE3-domain-containing protein [Rickenella mellea]
MLSMHQPGHSLAAFLAAFLVLIPLPCHWKARNVATVAIIAWLFVLNLTYAVNAIVWSNNAINHAPVYCDIVTKLIIGAQIALPAAAFCVAKHLELVASSRKVLDRDDRKRRLIFESIMCFGVPIIYMLLHFIVQGHRFDIIEDYGCVPTTYHSIPAVFLVYLPPLVLSVATFIYAALALRHFIKRRLSFSIHLQGTGSALTTQQYLRLLAMAVVEIMWSTALIAVNMWSTISPGLRPWTSMADVHSNFSRVDLYPLILLPRQTQVLTELFWWWIPVSAYVFFLFFGLGEETVSEYKAGLFWCRRNIFRRNGINHKSTTSLPTFRAYVPRRPTVVPVLPTIHTGDSSLKFEHSLPSPEMAFGGFPRSKVRDDDASSFTGTASIFSYIHSDAARASQCLSEPPLDDLYPEPDVPRSLGPRQHPTLYPAAWQFGNDQVFGTPGGHRPFSGPTIYLVDSTSTAPVHGIHLTVSTTRTTDV